jgi:hypothetical protein
MRSETATECQDLAECHEASHASELDYASMNDYVVVGGLTRSVTQFSFVLVDITKAIRADSPV